MVDKIILMCYSVRRERGAFMSITSLVLGILSILCSGCGLSWVGLLLGAVGIVFGAIARRNYEGNLATAGFILSIIGASFSALSLIIFVIIAAWAGNNIGYYY